MRLFNSILVCSVFTFTNAVVAIKIDPLPANGNIYVSDSGIGGIIEIDRTTYAPIAFHLLLFETLM